MPVHDLSFFKDWLGFQIEGSGSYENGSGFYQQ